MAQGNTENRLPVFVFPSQLTFFIDDKSSHKQVLTLYNPYEFPLHYKVLSTAPSKYNVVEPEGSIKSHCCVDLVVRHLSLTQNPPQSPVTDKFRILVTQHGNKQAMGKKDVIATVLTKKTSGIEESAESNTQEPFQSFQTNRGRSTSSQGEPDPGHLRSLPSQHLQGTRYAPNYVVLATAVICVAALLLPTEGSETLLPIYLQLSANQKLVFAYTLGLVTMVILRQ